LGFEVEIIDTKILRRDERRNRFAIKYWETRKEGSLYWMLKQLKKTFAAMMVNEEKPMA
jgi:malate dehydrogenase (oxaloacetate-decarboxylating)(NADP+)